jgi:hypothetical protein
MFRAVLAIEDASLHLKGVFMNLNVDSKDVKNLLKIEYCRHYTSYGKRRCWSFHSFNWQTKENGNGIRRHAYIILDDVDLEKTDSGYQ